MKKLLLTLGLIVAVAAIFAQAPMGRGGKQLNAGVGLSEWGVPVYIGMDFGISRDVSLGGELSFRSWEENYHNHHYDHSIIGISGNVNYHFNYILNIPQDWDFYAGLNLGYYFFNNPNDYPGDHESELGVAAQIGGRYFFTEKVGVNLEFGGGNAFNGGKLGITLKM